MRRTFERNLLVNYDRTTSHISCIDHCLLYVFNECKEIHTSQYSDCKDFFNFFDFINKHILKEHKVIINEIKEKLHYFLAHQVRKVYLNTQYKAALASLNNDNAVMIADYKCKFFHNLYEKQKNSFLVNVNRLYILF